MSRSTFKSLSALVVVFAGISLFSASLNAPSHGALLPAMHQGQTVVADGAMPPPTKPTKPLMVS